MKISLLAAVISITYLALFLFATKPPTDTTLQDVKRLRIEAEELLERLYEDEFTLTAYTNHHQCVKVAWLDGKTSSGTVAKYGTVAADLSILPYGTIVFIPDYGLGVVEDTGSAIIGKKIDLFFNTLGEAEKFGKQRKTVLIIKPRESK